ncbi:MAG: hypothetical protein AAGC63_03560 [Propionicimonas sp.]|nr:hypothetical protein [Propionicimonas sp.]
MTMPAGEDSTDHRTDARRDEWLAAQGPHALLRSVRSGGDWIVVALTLRPGTPTNTLARVALRLTASDGVEVVTPIPVFGSYHRQWTLDLTTGVRRDALAGADRWKGTLVLADADGDRMLPVLTAPRTAFSWLDLPDLAPDTRQWVLEPAAPAPNGGPA